MLRFDSTVLLFDRASDAARLGRERRSAANEARFLFDSTMRSARLTPRQYQGLPLTPRGADLPFHAIRRQFLGASEAALHELSPRLQPPSPRRTTPRPQSALHSPRFAASHPSITKAASRYRPASARPAAATAVSPAARSVAAAAAATAAAQLPRLRRRGRAAVAAVAARVGLVGSPRAHSSRRVGSAPTARATLPPAAAPAAVETAALAPAEPPASAPSAAEDAAADVAAPAAELEPLALLRAVDLLSGEDEATLQQLLQLGSLRRYRRYAVVAREGGDVDGLALLLAGSLLRTTQVASPYGASELRAGDAVDLEALVDGCGALRRDATYQAAEDAVVLVVGKKALSGLALGAARAPRSVGWCAPSSSRSRPSGRSSPPRSTLSPPTSRCAFHDEGGVVYRAGEPADRLFLVAEGSVAVLPADAVPPDDDDGGGGSPRRWSLTSADSGHGRRFSLGGTRDARPRWSRPTAPRRRGSAAPPRCSRRAGRRGRARRARWRCGRRSSSRSLRRTPTPSFRSHLSSWPSGRSRRSAPPACDSSSASRRRRRPRRRRATRSASRAGVAWWRSCSRGASASLLRPRGRR